MDHGFIDQFVGSQLKKLREDKQLTIEYVADYLRLNKNYIEDIENNNFTCLPHTYLKGYIRSYAKLLAIPERDIDVYLMNASKKNCIKGWKIFSDDKQVSASNRYIQWLTFVIFSTLIILVTMWWKSDNSYTVAVDDQSLEQPMTVAVKAK